MGRGLTPSDQVGLNRLLAVATGFKLERLSPQTLIMDLNRRPDWLDVHRRALVGDLGHPLWRVRIGRGPYCYGRSLSEAAGAALVLDAS